MAKARAIVKRRKSVGNIRKITRTMQLIATSRFQAAYKRATASRPYTQKITELVEQLSRGLGNIDHALLRENTESKRTVVIVITSNRGLCGGYNAGLLREALAQVKQAEEAGQRVDLHVVGKKGIGYFRFLKREMAATDSRFEDKPQFALVEPMAAQFIEQYERKQLDSVRVVYTRFLSTASQRVEVLQLLPTERPAGTEPAGKQAGAAADRAASVQYEFSPPPEELLAELLPETVKVRLFQCFIDSAASEQVARMVAMKAATDAAGDMVKTLARQYNRARQSQITLELLDIVSGAEALK